MTVDTGKAARRTSSALNAFAAARPKLIKMAYKMLGSVSDAEDVVQDACLRWDERAEQFVEKPEAYLATIVTRLCVDRLRSATRRRELYVGPWLPEPLVTAAGLVEDRTDLPGIATDVTVAVLLALERLSSPERAVFLLHDIFDFDFSEVAATLGKTQLACRQLASRARGHLRADRPRFLIDRPIAQQLAAFFMVAAASGDYASIRALLDEEALCLTDGGGQLAAALNPIAGADKVARFVVGLARKMPSTKTAQIYEATINGLPGFIVEGHSAHRETIAVEILDSGKIAAIYYCEIQTSSDTCSRRSCRLSRTDLACG